MNDVSSPDLSALNALLAKLVRAWNAGNGSAFAAPFASDGVQVNIFGMQLRGRDEIAERHDRVFQTMFRESENTLELLDARMAGPDVLIARIGSVVSVPHGALAGELRTIASLVLQRAGSGWEIVLFHITRLEPGQAAGRNQSGEDETPAENTGAG